MENNFDTGNRPVNPRRRKRSKMQQFKETYLPLVIAGTAALLIVIFVIGSITRAVQRSNANDSAKKQAAAQAAAQQKQLEEEAQKLAEEASLQAASYDYDSALATIDSFSGDIADYPQLQRLRQQYQETKETLVIWDDPSKIKNLSVQLLIADPARAFQDATYGKSYLENFITTEEFSRMLQQLYENGYILVDMSHITDGKTATPLALPEGKTPFMLTQTQVNYYLYMTDSNNDFLPDEGGAGFASKLVLDANGNLACEMITADGQTVTGAYDLVPILEAFIATHPDFSYRGARATLAVTGYDGIFGYRINTKARVRLGEVKYQEEKDQATTIVQALRNAGYTIACGTYENQSYGTLTATQIQQDLGNWESEIAPVLGVVDTLVFARNSDIASGTASYTGVKYDTLKHFGFRYYLGFTTAGKSWFTIESEYVRQGRILVNGSTLQSRGSWFSGMFDTNFILDDIRNDYTA